MTERELKRLSRTDLLTMMLSLSKENEQLRQQIEQMQQQLSSRTIAIQESGSLAEAALLLNGIFEAAQAACEQYTENIRQRSENQEQICARMERETRQKCERMIAQAKKQADALLQEAASKAQESKDSYSWLRDLMNDAPNTQD
ncbi:MAG: hypothetical protein J6J18_05955 [Oscillospiraceae bacterium]|nr:hypothetical protein [Oscillospiraceae bacterium]